MSKRKLEDEFFMVEPIPMLLIITLREHDMGVELAQMRRVSTRFRDSIDSTTDIYFLVLYYNTGKGFERKKRMNGGYERTIFTLCRTFGTVMDQLTFRIHPQIQLLIDSIKRSTRLAYGGPLDG